MGTDAIKKFKTFENVQGGVCEQVVQLSKKLEGVQKQLGTIQIDANTVAELASKVTTFVGETSVVLERVGNLAYKVAVIEEAQSTSFTASYSAREYSGFSPALPDEAILPNEA